MSTKEERSFLLTNKPENINFPFDDLTRKNENAAILFIFVQTKVKPKNIKLINWPLFLSLNTLRYRRRDTCSLKERNKKKTDQKIRKTQRVALLHIFIVLLKKKYQKSSYQPTNHIDVIYK